MARPLRNVLAAALAASALGACDLGALAAGAPAEAAVSAPTLAIPPARGERKKRSVDDALSVYPAIDAALRDPFFTVAEEEALRTGAPIVEAIAVVAAPVAKKPGRKSLGGLEAIEGDVSFIVFGQNDGKRTAVWRGRTLQEGQPVGDFVVVSITEDGISLKEKGGNATRTLKFRREAADVWK